MRPCSQSFSLRKQGTDIFFPVTPDLFHRLSLNGPYLSCPTLFIGHPSWLSSDGSPPTTCGDDPTEDGSLLPTGGHAAWYFFGLDHLSNVYLLILSVNCNLGFYNFLNVNLIKKLNKRCRNNPSLCSKIGGM